MDDSTGSVVLAALGADLATLWAEVVQTEALDRETAEGTVRDGMLANRGAVVGGGSGGTWDGQGWRALLLSLRWGGDVRRVSGEGRADGGGLDHAASGLLRLPHLRPRALSARCALGGGAG